MIAGISIIIAAYEALALITRKPPTVTRLSHTKAGVFVWLWLVSLAIHLIRGEDAAPLTPPLSAVRVRVHAPRVGRSR